MYVQSPMPHFDRPPQANSPDLEISPEEQLLDLCTSILKTDLRKIPKSIQTMTLFVGYTALRLQGPINVNKIQEIARKLFNPAGYDHCGAGQRRLTGATSFSE